MGADNQQERLDPNWVTGFVDGEGCFYVAINRQPKMKLGWQVLPEFRIVQHQRDEQLLKSLQLFFGCGTVTVNHGDRKELRIRGIDNLSKVVDFFRTVPLRSKKQKDFEIFAEIIEMIKQGLHNSSDGLNAIALLASRMNRQTVSSYLASSETTRPTLARVKI